ncbi:MAG: hypothetical protein ACOYEV_05005 [Candidatus Nanopelagicales bacterium]
MIQHFLLVYDHSKGQLVETIEFGPSSTDAVRRYGQLEALHRHEPQIDIVLVGSDSLETIRITHRNYFDDTSTLSSLEADLRGVLSEFRPLANHSSLLPW